MIPFLSDLVGAFFEKGFAALLGWLQQREIAQKLREGEESKAKLAALQEQIRARDEHTKRLKALSDKALLNDWDAAP